MDSIYLDHAATTPMDPQVFEVMKPYLKEHYGNPSSMHSIGQTAKQALDQSRRDIAKILGCNAREVIFTGSGTESDNLAIFGVAKKGDHVITTQIEHPAVLEPCRALERRGCRVTYLPVNKEGFIDLNDLEKTLTPETVLVSIIYANNEIGTIQPINEIADLLKKHKNPKLGRHPFFHTDACQCACSLDINVDNLGVDLMTLNASKIYGPKGVGLLYVRGKPYASDNQTGPKLTPQIYGGGHEFSLRAGTENMAGIVGFTKALALATENHKSTCPQVGQLRDHLFEGLTKALPDIQLNGPALTDGPEKRLPNNLNLTIKAVPGEVMLIRLDTEGICASTASACHAGKTDPSHVLTALGRSKQEAESSIRFSLGNSTTKEQIDYVIEKFTKIVQEVRKESGIY